MKKRMLAGMMAFIMAGMLTACGSSSSVSEAAKSGEDKENKTNTGSAEDGNSGSASVVLKLGHIQSESDLWNLGAVKFADRVSELSNGDIKIEIYPNSTLGGDRDMAEGLMMGTVDISLIAGVLSNFDDTISVLEIPYLFRSNEEFEKVIYGDVGKEIAAHVLDTFSAWGAAATTMSWSEVYPSLQQGVIEAQENPIPFFYSGSIYEVNKYIANTNHKYEYVTMAMSDTAYSKLSEEQQKIIMQAAQEATEYENQETKRVTEENLKDMVENQGVTVTDPDISGFIKIADEVAPKYAKSIGQLDLYNKIQETLGR